MFSLDFQSIEMRLAQSAVPTRKKLKDPIEDIIQQALAPSCTIFVRQGRTRWTGSGFHIGEGLIITASHVAPPESAHNGSEITVTFDGVTVYEAATLVSRPEIDAAVLSCPPIAKNVPKMQFGDSDAVQVGEMALVLGSPEGFHDTATFGRISNIHQGLGETMPAWNDLIFIDAEIHEGVSGGMVITSDARVIGSVIGVTGQHANVGVGENAVCPINKIKAMLSALLEG